MTSRETPECPLNRISAGNLPPPIIEQRSSFPRCRKKHFPTVNHLASSGPLRSEVIGGPCPVEYTTGDISESMIYRLVESHSLGHLFFCLLICRFVRHIC